MSSALDRINEYNKKKKKQYTSVIDIINKSNNGVSALDRINNYSKTHNLTLSEKDDKQKENENIFKSDNLVNKYKTPIKKETNSNKSSNLQNLYNPRKIMEEAKEKGLPETAGSNKYTGNVMTQLEGMAKLPLNLLVETGKGIVDFGESVLDTGLQIGSSKYNPGMWIATGQTPWSKDQSKLNQYQNIAKSIIKEDASQKFIDETLGYSDVLSNGKTIQETLDKNSIIRSDNKGGQIFRNVGSQLPSMMIGAGGLGKAGQIGSNIAFGTNAYGGALEQAYNKGADRKTANTYALTEAGIELLTEQIYQGIGSPIYGKGIGIDDVIKQKVAQKLGNTVASKLAMMGIGAVAEGGEEVASELLNQLVKKASELTGGQMQKLIDEPDYANSFVDGVLSSLVIGGMQTGVNNKNNNSNLNTIESNSQQEQAVENNLNIDYNKNEGDINEQRRNISNMGEDGTDVGRGMGILQTNERVSNILQTNDERINRNQEGITNKNRLQQNEVVENNSKIDYNTTGGDVYGQVSGNSSNFRGNDRQGLGGLLNNQEITNREIETKISERKFNAREYEQFEQGIERYKSTKLTQEELNLKNDIKKQYGKDIVFFDGDLAYDGGASIKNKDVIYISKSLSNEDQKFVANHEMMESAIRHDKELSNEYIKPIINDIIQDGGFNSTKKSFSLDQDLSNASDYMIAKDIFCDAYANYKTGVDVGYKNELSDSIKEQMQYIFERYEDSINKTNKVINDVDNSKKGIAPIYSPHTGQQNNKKQIAPIVREKNEINASIKNEVLKVKPSKESISLAKTLNETMHSDTITLKERSWIETSLESEAVKDKVLIQDLDSSSLNYVVQTNKSTLEQANNQLDNLGYEEAVNYAKAKINDDKLSLTDLALVQRLIQEASKKGDINIASDLIMDAAIIGTDLGQKVQALSIIQRLTPEGQLRFYQKLVQRAKVKGDKSFSNVEITPEMVELILGAYKQDGSFEQNDLNNRVEQFKQKVADQLNTSTAEKVTAWRYLSMLGNPKTHIRNVVSNVAMWGTLKVKNSVARTIETFAPIETKTKTWKKSSKEISDFAKTTTNEMKDIITGESKYNEKTSIESKKTLFKNKVLEKIKDFNSDMLSKEDWFFSKNAFENTFREYLTAQGINTKEDINNNQEIIEKAKLYALEQAEKATFRQYSWLANQIGKIERKNAFTKVVVGSTIPFKKTPINIAKTGVSYSPIGLLKSVSYDAFQVSQGNMEASQFIDNLSQGITGTSLTLIGYALAKAGLLKGAGDDDKEGKYDSYLGNQTYSIKIGDSTYSISWLSPVAMPLLVGATAYEKLEEQAEWDMNVVVDTLAQTLDPLSEMSFLSSLDDVLSSYDSGVKKIAGMVGSMGQNYLTQFIPTLFSQIASTMDDKKRTTRASNNSSWKYGEETVRKVMYKIPIVRNQLEESTDIWGNPVEQSDNIIERALENFIAPYSKKKDITTNLDKELKRLYNSTGETGVIPGVPNAYIKYDGVTYQLSASEYTNLKKIYGQTANSCLSELINSNSYKNATVEEQVKMIKNVYDYTRAKAYEEYFKNTDVEYENNALNKINTLSNEYGISASTYFANKEQYDYAYKNPEKYAVIKQITTYDKYVSYKEKIDNIRENTTNDRTETIKFINNLDLSIPQKAMFIKMYYPSFKNYDSQIVNHVKKNTKSSAEKEKILTILGFTVKDGKVYY